MLLRIQFFIAKNNLASAENNCKNSNSIEGCTRVYANEYFCCFVFKYLLYKKLIFLLYNLRLRNFLKCMKLDVRKGKAVLCQQKSILLDINKIL